jgi:thiamine-monophosphate kinase
MAEDGAVVAHPVDPVSDEPTRLENIVRGAHAELARGWRLGLENNAVVELIAGAEAQDDCAVYRLGAIDLVVGSDYVRGPKFFLYEAGLLSEEDLGYYLAIANFSDVAAMGATPIGLLTVVRYPATMDDRTFASILAGIDAACHAVGAPSVGGDIGGAERLILSGTALGVTEAGRVLTRAGARVGDVLFVSSATGVAGAALQLFRKHGREKGLEHPAAADLLQAWTRPTARVDLGTALRSLDGVTSCQDTSDGLKATIESIALRSGVGFELDAASIPTAPAVTAVAGLLGVDALTLTLSDSPDFELLFTATAEAAAEVEAQLAAKGIEVFRIGRAVADGIRLVEPDGAGRPLPGEAWRHRTDLPTELR